tara:strand:- start:164 stop:367 length:204 start_codon:yes stop_codon:yes gene_type:complete
METTRQIALNCLSDIKDAFDMNLDEDMLKNVILQRVRLIELWLTKDELKVTNSRLKNAFDAGRREGV